MHSCLINFVAAFVYSASSSHGRHCPFMISFSMSFPFILIVGEPRNLYSLALLAVSIKISFTLAFTSSSFKLLRISSLVFTHHGQLRIYKSSIFIFVIDPFPLNSRIPLSLRICNCCRIWGGAGGLFFISEFSVHSG